MYVSRRTCYRHGFRAIVLVCVFVLLRSYFMCSSYICPNPRQPTQSPDHANRPLLSRQTTCPEGDTGINDRRPRGSVAVVASTVEAHDISWLWDNFPAWEIVRYIMDNPSANKTIPKNKGSESMAYLTYIIDNYKDLPEFMIFSHGSRYQWHNDDPMYDGVPVLYNLRLSNVAQQGYVNLRCTWELGCPDALRPYRRLPAIEAFLEPRNDRANMEASYAHAFEELFGREAPEAVAAPCCAQFAVSRAQVRKRTLCEYRHYREWLLNTELPSSVSGRIMEYSWHMIMSMPPVHCPTAQRCYCESFGLCRLSCNTPGSCRGRYWQPPKYRIPKGWPDVGPGAYGLPSWGWQDRATV